MKTTTVSILRKDIKKYIEGVINTNEAVLINKGADGAVLISLDEYNRLTEAWKARTAPMVPSSLLESIQDESDKGYIDVNVDEL